MDNNTLKALIMAIMSPTAIGAPLNDTSFKNLSTNAQKIIDHCIEAKD